MGSLSRSAPGGSSPRDQTPAAAPGRRGRLVGIDLARFIALLGMFAAHTLYTGRSGGDVPWYTVLIAGRPSALFALLGGISLVLAARSRERVGDLSGARRAAGLRALVIIWLGLIVATPSPRVGVILVVYGLLWCIVLPVMQARPRTLLAIAAGWTVAAPALSVALRGRWFPDPWDIVWNPSVLSLLVDPLRSVASVLLTGMYPVLTWVPYVLVGLAAGRLLTGAQEAGPRALRGTSAVLGLTGTVAAVLGWAVSRVVRSQVDLATRAPGWEGSDEELRALAVSGFHGTSPAGEPIWLLVAAPHSGSIADLVVTTGAALATLGGCLLLADVLGRSPVGAALQEVPARAGAMTLTLYTAHVLVMGLPSEIFGVLQEGLSAVVAWSAIAVLAGAAGAVSGRRGPLEAALARLVAFAVPIRPAGRD